MISGFATLHGTREFSKKFDMPYRKSRMFYTSPIALGTHLGDMNEIDSNLYRKGLEYGMRHGLNFIDTAINYRGMKSERDVGYVLKNLITNGIIKREEIVISTKAGIIPGDIEANLVPIDYLQKVLLQGDVIKESDINIVDTHRHVLVPSYYQFAIGESKKHLNLETIDIYYIHNPEISMTVLGADLFYQKLEELFNFMEEQVQAGNIKYYGFATWYGFLRTPKEQGYISIEEVINTAKKVAGENHHFQFIQFPLNRQMTEGVNNNNQKVNNHWVSLVNAAKELGILATTSAPFNLGKEIIEEGSPRKILLDVIRTKGILSTMVGMKNIHHIKENIEVLHSIIN